MLDIIREFGYFFVFLGTFIEGEATLVIAGVLIHDGSLTFPKVVVVSFLASYLSHMSFYLLGYLGGNSYLRKLPYLEEKVARIYSLIRRYETLGVFLCQYIVGLRLASAAAFALVGMPPLKYGVFQLISCFIWVSLFSLLGYLFGYSAEPYIKSAKKLLLLVMVFAILLAWVLKRAFDVYLKRHL